MGGGESVWEVMNSWLTPSFLFLFLNLTIGTIAVISSFATQNNKPSRQQQQQQQQQLPLIEEDEPPRPPVLARAPSLLDRVRSFNFSFYAGELSTANAHSTSYPHESPEFQTTDAVTPADPPPPQQQQRQEQLSRAPSLLERLKSFNLSFQKYELPQPEPEPAPEAPGAEQPAAPPADLREPEKEASVSQKVPEKMMRKSTSSRLSATGSRNMEEEDGEEVDRRRPATTRERGSGRETASFGGEDEGVDARADDFINRFRQQLKLQRLDSIMRYREMLMREKGGGASGK